ncbi:MAG: putative sugar nucleotidyl transferase [bacterium]
MEIILYEDSEVSGLYPVTLTRPAFDIRTGGYTLLEAVNIVFPKALVFAHSRALVHDVSHVHQFSDSEKTTGGFLFLNARLAPSLTDLKLVANIVRDSKEVCFIDADGTVAGFFTETLTHKSVEIAQALEHHAKGGVRHNLNWKLLTHPEDIIFFNRDELADNLRIATEKMRAKKRGLYLGVGVKLPKECVYDTSKGPIVIGDHVMVAPFTVLKGPLMIGQSSIIKEFTVIEGCTTIGPVCKVGGEVSGSVMDGYSNKQHTGCLFDSYIGRWVNLGGGTFTADLKNTYSTITIQGRDSGSQFLGSVFGDFSKTSINTSIFPGRVIGVCAHLYDTVAEDVPSFTSHVRPGMLYELPLRLAQKGQEAMAVRRGVLWNDMDTARLEKLFEMTAPDREAQKVSKEKISFY